MDAHPPQERQGVAVQALPVLGQPPAPVQPADGSLNNPTFGQNHGKRCSTASSVRFRARA